MHDTCVIVGSLRRGSINRKFAQALEKFGADRFRFTYPDLDLPLYNQDLWDDPPAGVMRLKEAAAASDAVLIVMPEYNRGIPPVVKNALDWAQRPVGDNAWEGKPVAVAGASSGKIGTAVGQSHLRSILPVYDMHLLNKPAVYFQFAENAVNAEGEFADPEARTFLTGFLDAFDAWIRRLA